jgi:hypothetical protein
MRVLFICPAFHDYEKLIIDELKRKGFVVYPIVYNEAQYRKNNMSLCAILQILKLLLSLFGYHTETLKLYNLVWGKVCFSTKRLSTNILDNIKSLPEVTIEVLFVIKGFGINPYVLKSIKNRFNIKYALMYQWDPIIRFPSVLKIYPVFDHVFTFEPNDRYKYKRSIYLQTFYIEQENDFINHQTHENKIDFVFIGKFSLYRYKLLKQLKKIIRKNNGSYYFHLVKPTLLPIKYLDVEIVKNTNLSYKDVEILYRDSKCIVEINHPGQQGYTQRVYDAIYMHKYILTTSAGIVHEEFWRPEQFFLFDNKLNEHVRSILKNKIRFKENRRNIIDLSTWIDKIFSHYHYKND